MTTTEYITLRDTFRRVEPSELDTVLGEPGRGLLVLAAEDGKRSYVDNPGKFPREKWAAACQDGRVYQLWSRTWDQHNEPINSKHKWGAEAVIAQAEAQQPVAP